MALLELGQLLLIFIFGGSSVAVRPSSMQCPFCPHAKTATQFGAAASFHAISGMGKFSLNETMAAVKAEGLDVLGTECYKCEDWALLPAQLEAAAHYGIKMVAGFESESRLGSYCPNFLVGKKAGGLVDWPGLAAQLANLSLVYPNLIGYRFDDFIGCVHLNQYGDFSAHPNREVYYGGLPSDTAKMQAAAKAINPAFKMIAVFYDAQLASQSPYSYSFGQRAWLQPPLPDCATCGHHGGFFPAGASATMTVTFRLSNRSVVAASGMSGGITLSFLELTDFLYEVRTPTQLAAATGLVQRTVSINSCVLLENDVANLTDATGRPNVRAGILMHNLSIAAICLNSSGINKITWGLRGTAPLARWASRPHKNLVSVWDIELAGHGIIDTGDDDLLAMPTRPTAIGGSDGGAVAPTRWLVGNGSWSTVDFKLVEGNIVPRPIAGQVGQLFGSSNRAYSQLPQVDAILLCWLQMDPLWPSGTNGHGIAADQTLYQTLLRSARRAFAGPDALAGRNYEILSTHFGMLDWKGLDAAADQNPAISRAGIVPANIKGQMMVDAWMADGIYIWWDLIGLSANIAAQRGVFGPQSGGHVVEVCPKGNASNPSAQPKYEYLQLEEIEGVGLLRGWYQRVTSAAPGVRAGKLNLTLLEGSKMVSTPGFATSVELQIVSSGEWRTVWRRGSNESCPSLCNRTVLTLQSCDVVCVTGKPNKAGKVLQSGAQMSLVLSGTTMVRVTLQTAEDTGGNRGVCVSGGTSVGASGRVGVQEAVAPVAWEFWSGIDPLESSVQVEEETIMNATSMLKDCTCAGVE
jgi:hypothetical protein